ncbi:hypothetical protein O7634_00975 [Micromonospora sp. WMMD1120]|uniref:hypothetical protein n=1 Tax=Micromonospora sp. WMMD1120 TaxID=3016106 RepID=UPI002415FEE9|nr:hypothetical protein [Micromonospora sp. WMMD1120]MDG4805329.1 hypothetical protein [Micromonospora sp. WMMD1120]
MGMMGHNGVANARRTRLTAGWVPAQRLEPREYQVTDGPVANARRSRAEDELAAGNQP